MNKIIIMSECISYVSWLPDHLNILPWIKYIKLVVVGSHMKSLLFLTAYFSDYDLEIINNIKIKVSSM